MRLLPLIAVTGLLALSGCVQPPEMKEHAYPAWGFAVSFPDEPKMKDIPAAADGSTRHAMLLELDSKGQFNIDRIYLVNVIDGTGSTKSEDQALDDAPAALAKSVGGTLGPMTYDGLPTAKGREFTLTRPGHQPSHVRIFVRNQHLYEIVFESSLGSADPADKAFHASFRLL